MKGISGKALSIRVTPKAAANRVKAQAQPDGTEILRVYVTTAPEDGKANKAVLELLAKHLGVSKSSLTITRGAAGRDKIVRIKA
ncbi:MAG: DUF167 domain-containing protein [Alphaproteobacteria bacterium]|nr:DUF167 domain-containing protein [Alphaproteobacteria bacterium]